MQNLSSATETLFYQIASLQPLVLLTSHPALQHHIVERRAAWEETSSNVQESWEGSQCASSRGTLEHIRAFIPLTCPHRVGTAHLGGARMSPVKLSSGSAVTMSSWAWMQSRSLPFCQFSTLLFWFLPYQNIPISLLPRNCLALCLYFRSSLLQPVKTQLTAPCSLQRIPYQVLDDQRSDSYNAQVKYVQEICSFLSVQSRTQL